MAILKKSILLLLLLGYAVITRAQSSFPSDKNAIAASVNYEIPYAHLSDTYNAAPGFALGYYRFLNDHISLNASFGYRQFQPKQPTSTIGSGVGAYITYTDPFTSYAFYIGGAYYLPLGNNVNFYGGINIGLYYTIANSSSNSIVNGVYTPYHEVESYFAPKAGLTIDVAKNIQLGLQTDYNIFTKGKTNYYSVSTNTSIYTSSFVQLYTSLATGISIMYRF